MAKTVVGAVRLPLSLVGNDLANGTPAELAGPYWQVGRASGFSHFDEQRDG